MDMAASEVEDVASEVASEAEEAEEVEEVVSEADLALVSTLVLQSIMRLVEEVLFILVRTR